MVSGKLAATPTTVFRIGPVFVAAAALFAAALGTGFANGVAYLLEIWFNRPEYSHGILIPGIAAFLIWQQRDRVEQMEFTGSWWGVGLVLSGIAIGLIGQLATLYVIIQYGLLISVYGLILAATGARVFRLLWMPLLVLVFMIPLPEFLLNNFSQQLQLLSSQIGVIFIRMCGISVFASGNVIDLGVYQLQVAEACDGLRYLFPLMTLGFILAYFFKAPMWKRVLVFVSSIPVSIFMNSFRVGTIGIMVEYWGTSVAEGFLHDFQGWAVFIASAVVLVVEMLILARLGGDRRPLREVLGVEFPAPAPSGAINERRPIPASFIAGGILIGLGSVLLFSVPNRSELLPDRRPLSLFPREVAEWSGTPNLLEQIYLEALQLDDYLVMDYAGQGVQPVNLYIAWYDSQRAGESAHSPRSCIPGGGWQITALEQRQLAGIAVGGVPLAVNRAVIEYGNERKLVYYWFQQRGRVVTNEYLVKWYLFWDSLTRRRTDGALVRLIAPMTDRNDADADRTLAEISAEIAPILGQYIPG